MEETKQKRFEIRLSDEEKQNIEEKAKLKKVGTNINQIAHKLNSNGEFDTVTKDNLNMSLSEVTKSIKMCESILEATYGCPFDCGSVPACSGYL